MTERSEVRHLLHGGLRSWRSYRFVTKAPHGKRSGRQHGLNWAVNKAIKRGIEVRYADSEDDLKAWYPLYLLTKRHNAVPARSYRFFPARVTIVLGDLIKLDVVRARFGVPTTTSSVKR